MSSIYQNPPKSNQEAFDRVWQTFIVEQKPRALGMVAGKDFPTCVYRTDDGHGCAIGCQLPDALYRPAMEGLRASGVLQLFPAVQEHFTAVDMGFLNELQSAHDASDSEDITIFSARLREVAKFFKLQVAA